MKVGLFTQYLEPELREAAVKSCQKLGVDYEVVDILSSDWMSKVKKSDCDGFFCTSTCVSQEMKTLLDERYYFVSQIMRYPIYPDYTGMYIHESKRNMATFLELNSYPHAKTRVFVNREEALEYINECEFPLVTKSNVGSGASKVIVLKKKSEARRMARRCLDNSYISFLKPGFAYKMRFRRGYIPRLLDIRNLQKDYLILQEYVKDVLHEWRIIKVGDSYFGHQKLKKGEFASGSGLVGWVAPPRVLLDMVRELCEKGGFRCMDVDIFETAGGDYVINEMQASFGSYSDFQMSIDGRHGRYVWRDNDYHFEEGDFNIYRSLYIQIEDFVSVLSKKGE